MSKAFLASAVVALGVLAGVRDAAACGGCFHPTAEQGSSVITDHRMVLKVSTTETILWDQVRYSGNPSEFVWVLPVRAGARVELSRDAWITALDTATHASVRGPEISCSSVVSTGGGGPSSSPGSSARSKVASGGASGGGGGGGCASSSSDTAYDPGYATSSDTPPAPEPPPVSSPGFAGNEDVSVVTQSVIGPYQAVTIHSTDGKGIAAWLTESGFAVPDAVKPIVDAYTQAGFDFIALRLRPDAGVRAMRPVRVLTPGADVTLPLRMVSAGVGAHVGLTLWVLGEGRYHTQNFPDAPVDWSELAWDANEDRSNLRELSAAALAANDGRSWLTEAAMQTGVTAGTTPGTSLSLYDAYQRQCAFLPPREEPCDPAALPPADAGDAGTDADADPDAGAPAPACTNTVSGCDGYDDLTVATRGLHPNDVWVTRLRADLPSSALAVDLRLEATSDQTAVYPTHQTTKFTDPSFDPCARTQSSGSSGSSGGGSSTSTSQPPAAHDTGGCTCRTARLRDDLGTAVVVALGMLGVAAVTRRRRR
jgi:hypothetical protein